MLSESLLEARQSSLGALRPPPRLSLPEWTEAHVRLPGDLAATPGPMRLFHYQRGLADAMGAPEIERVTVLKAARVGYSALLTAVVGSYVANDPTPIIALLPTEADCRDFTVSALDPTFDASPILRGLLADDADASNRSTMLHRRFPGGSLRVIAAKAPRNLRAKTARVLLIDESDGMADTAEGSPILLAEKRTLTFPDRKIIMGSTPTDEATSHVWRAWQESDQRVYLVPCPQCAESFEVRWACIKWPESEPENAYCECPHCGGVIEEREKGAMVAAGAWVATRPEIRGHAGFRLSALISTLANAAWGKLAQEFLAAKRGGPETLKPFVNTVLGEPWRDAADEIDENELAARAEAFGLDAIPTEIRILTAGVDVQHDRLECSVLGFTADDSVCAMRHEVFYGDVLRNTVWTELDDFLKRTWPHPLGGKIGLAAVAVDSGDGNTTDAVHGFTRARYGRRVISIKGAAGQRPTILHSGQKGTHLHIVGVDGVKTRLFQSLAANADKSRFRFSDSLPPVWYEQLTSERRVLKYSHGRPMHVFERVRGKRAESLDCVVYALAVRGLVKADMLRVENGLREITQAPAMPAVTYSSFVGNTSGWMNRGKRG